jgi:hypothetical protein
VLGDSRSIPFAERCPFYTWGPAVAVIATRTDAEVGGEHYSRPDRRRWQLNSVHKADAGHYLV